MREITTHKVKPDEAIKILAIDEPGPGGASACYAVVGPHFPENPALLEAYKHTGVSEVALANHGSFMSLVFQSGNPAEHANGLTIEALLAICADKLEGHQSSQFACEENAVALMGIKGALLILKSRTARRVAQGVEGTQAPEPESTGLTHEQLHAKVNCLVRELVTLRHCLSYNDSYAGEPAGLIKADVDDWERKGVKGIPKSN